jgi:16S rRNA (guanine527-N7)-methyltransferase
MTTKTRQHPAEDRNVTGLLNSLLVQEDLPVLDPLLENQFDSYLSLIVRWNSRTALTAVREEREILSRHFVESIACAVAVPQNVRTLLDFGSGAGFPGIPIALCRSDISVTLAESQNKKAAFLREAARTLGLKATVHGGRAENLTKTFDCVVLRAVDHMETAVAAASHLLSFSGWIMIMTTRSKVLSVQEAAGSGFLWERCIELPLSEDRVITTGRSIAQGQ